MAHRVSNVKTAGAGGNKQYRVHRDGNSIYATDGTIWTGHYDRWATMKDADKEKVTAERERKKKARNGKGSKGKTYKRKVSDLSSLTEDIQAMKRSVAELISKRDETVDQGATKHHVMMPGMPLGDGPLNSRSKVIDSYPLCNQPIVSHPCYKTRSEFVCTRTCPTLSPPFKDRIQHPPPAAAKAKRRPTSLPTEGCIELDSHADTIVLGANCIILSHTGQSCEVMTYSDTYNAITDVPVVTGATLWTSPHDGDEFILIFNEALWMGNTLQHTLGKP